MAAVLAVYGMVSNPADVSSQLHSFSGALPADMRTLLDQQLHTTAGRVVVEAGLRPRHRHRRDDPRCVATKGARSMVRQ